MIEVTTTTTSIEEEEKYPSTLQTKFRMFSCDFPLELSLNLFSFFPSMTNIRGYLDELFVLQHSSRHI